MGLMLKSGNFSLRTSFEKEPSPGKTVISDWVRNFGTVENQINTLLPVNPVLVDPGSAKLNLLRK